MSQALLLSVWTEAAYTPAGDLAGLAHTQECNINCMSVPQLSQQQQIV